MATQLWNPKRFLVKNEKIWFNKMEKMIFNTNPYGGMNAVGKNTPHF
jgi:hypothetical protein